MSVAGIVGIAAGVMVVLLIVLEFLAWAAHVHSFIATVILGADNRTSTSKTFIFMWTLLVGWGLISLLIAGEFIHIHSCVPSAAAVNAAHDVTTAAHACTVKGDKVGLLQVGWLNFLHTGLSGGYLVVLGVPAAAGVAAKGITTAQVSQTGTQAGTAQATGVGFKARKTQKGSPFQRVTEIFSADDGTTDVGDFQYMIFNLVTAAYFVVQFVNPDGTGLPTIPDTLLGLTSVSASLYVGKKAVSRSKPVVTGVFPVPLRADQSFTVIGTDLTADPADATDVRPQITIDGLAATLVTVSDDVLVAKPPPTVGAGNSPIVRQLQVLNPYGGITPNFPVQCL